MEEMFFSRAISCYFPKQFTCHRFFSLKKFNINRVSQKLYSISKTSASDASEADLTEQIDFPSVNIDKKEKEKRKIRSHEEEIEYLVYQGKNFT